MAMDQSLDRQTSHTHPNVTLLGGDPSLLLPTSRKKEGGGPGTLGPLSHTRSQWGEPQVTRLRA